MRGFSTVVCVGGLFLVLGLTGMSTLGAQEGAKGDMVPNHIYKHWSNFKVGTSVHRKETVKFAPDSEEGSYYPEHTLVKEAKYKLTNLTAEKAVVEVYEEEHGRGFLKVSAPVKMIYFATMKKGQGTPKESFTKHKQEDVNFDWNGKTYKATLIETSYKIGPETSSQKIWLSDEIPGGILKDTKSRQRGDKIITESTEEVVSVHIP
jgi:hypothetical protein